MKKPACLFVISLLCLNLAGCWGVIVLGAAATALGAYAVSSDTIEADTDKAYNRLWDAAIKETSARNAQVQQDDKLRGYIELKIGPSWVWIRLIKLTQTTTRVRISARKYHLPNLGLAQDIFVKMMEGAK